MNKKTLLAGIAAVALFSSAAMAEGWNGAYIGLTGGYATGESNFTGTGALAPSEENPNSEGTIDAEGAQLPLLIPFQ